MRTSTWAQIEDDVRVRMDLPVFSTATKPTGAQLMRMGNQSLQARDAILAESYGDDYRAASIQLPTVSGLALVSLPDDFVKARGLFWHRGVDDIVRMRRASLHDVERLSMLAPRSWSSESPMYRFGGTSALSVMPTPNAVYTLTLHYIQTSATIALATDAIQDGPGWTEWLVADLCAKIATLREEDPSMFVALRNDAESRIREQSRDRDEGQPCVVNDRDAGRPLGHQDEFNWLTYYG